MMSKTKKIFLTLLLTCSVVALASGCDRLKKEPETESETQTERVTEAPTESETQTEYETQPRELTVEEELAQETELGAIRTVYAADDINVRTQPGTGETSEIFDSFDQGETIRVVGETPNWYVVDLDDYEENGYVSKQFVSDQEVAPKTEEERAQLAAGGASETDPANAASDGTDTAAAANTDGTSSVDQEYGVQTYAESFPVQATTGANMRSTPAQDGEIINTIASGTSVTAIGYTDRWYKVEYNGTVGYVNQNLFTAE